MRFVRRLGLQIQQKMPIISTLQHAIHLAMQIKSHIELQIQ